MFALIPAYVTVSREALAARPTYTTIEAAFADLTAGKFMVRVPTSKVAKRADIVAWHETDMALASHLNARLPITGGTARACKHLNVGVPLIARTDKHAYECFTCGAGIDA